MNIGAEDGDKGDNSVAGEESLVECVSDWRPGLHEYEEECDHRDETPLEGDRVVELHSEPCGAAGCDRIASPCEDVDERL